MKKRTKSQNHSENDEDSENEVREEKENENETPFKESTDICQQLMDRYSKSSAPQHRHLLATAATMRSILSSESLPLSPPAYFAAAISSLDDSQTLDSTAIGALLTFFSIVVPIVPPQGIAAEKAKDAVEVLARLVKREGLGVASVRSAVKCFGVLLVGFCDLENWSSVHLSFETLLNFSVDKRPKVRRCAQEWLEMVFKSFQCSTVIKEASKLVHSLLKKHMPIAVNLSTTKAVDGSKDETSLKPEHLEVLHVLSMLKLTFRYLSVKVSSKVLSDLHELMRSDFSPITRHILKTIEVVIGKSKKDAVIPEMENIMISLASYASLGENNPVDTVIHAATLLKCSLDDLHFGDSNSRVKIIPLVCRSIAGLLTSGASTASQASVILKELINQHIDGTAFLDDYTRRSEEANATHSMCSIFETILSSCDGIPNEHILAVISVLFQKLGKSSYVFMKSIILKLAGFMNSASGGMSDTSHLQNCIGYAVFAMGPKKMLTLVPISLNANDLTCSNIWLIPILKGYVAGASLGYYMEHIVPLAQSFHQASRTVKKSVIGQDLQTHARGLWGLLPTFCRYCTDTHKKFGSLAELMIRSLKKGSYMYEIVSLGIQILVNQNKKILRPESDAGESDTFMMKDFNVDFRNLPSYSKESATRNINTLASCSTELLQALTSIFVHSSPAKRSHIKDAIGCLASIIDSSITKTIFMSLLSKLKFINGEGELEKQSATEKVELVDEEQGNQIATEKDAQRCVILELASSLVEGAKEDLIYFVYDLIKHTFQATNDIGHDEAYNALSKILKEHAWFCSSRFMELIDLLLGIKPSVDFAPLRSRFDCFHVLMVHALQMSLEGENAKPFLILNEIILTLKDGKEEARKAAYDVLLKIGSSVRSLLLSSDSPYHKLVSMILGYLSGSSPHIQSGAVSALSVLVYSDPDICLSMPDLLSSLLNLLQTKALEVIKAVLGFVKVLVSSLQPKDLQNFLPDVVRGVLPWSSVSRNHFRSKVIVIVEIMIRKCGTAGVMSLTPEKYKDFMHTVLQNRRGKTSSKEDGANETEPVLADPSTKGLDRRKDNGLSSLPKENGSGTHRKRKWGKKEDASLRNSSERPKTAAGSTPFKSAKRARHFKKSRGDHSDQGKKRYRTDLKKGPPSGKKRKMEQVNSSRKAKAAAGPNRSFSKVHKSKKVWKKRK